MSHYEHKDYEEDELELERTREITKEAEYRKEIMDALKNRAEQFGKTMIMICDVSHTRFEDRSNGFFNQYIRPEDIRAGMDLGICGKLQDMKTKEELPDYADCFVEQALVEIDNSPFDLLVVESNDTIYIGFGPERERIKDRVELTERGQEIIAERERAKEREIDEGRISPWEEEYPAPTKNDDFEIPPYQTPTKDDDFTIPPYPAPGRQEPLIIPSEPEEEPEHDDEFEIIM